MLLVLAAIASMMLPSRVSADAERVELIARPPVSADGVYQLSWNLEGAIDRELLLEESREPSFLETRVVYRGPDRATTLTGRSDGAYFYRLQPSTPSSMPSDGESVPLAATMAHVVVAHHPLPRALGFFVVGFIVFAATVGLVLRGPESASGTAGPPDWQGAPTRKDRSRG